MYDIYLVTGATGYLGSTVVKRLLRMKARVRALVLPDDGLADTLPSGVETVTGSVDDRESLKAFFCGDMRAACVIHCAGIVSIASRNDERLRRVNVKGTENIVEMCRERGVKKLVYVSSVHAIPEKSKGECISECSSFSPDRVVGDYAKSKAEATAIVLRAAANGLNASVVHPSGIIGPYDSANGSVTGTIRSYCSGKLSAGVKGGYDFVDVRDVAEGIVACCERGGAGECYILSNRYASVREILETLRGITKGKRILFCAPLRLVKLIAPLCEKLSLRKKRPLFLTPYSVYTLGVNSRFDHTKATHELDYRPRELNETLKDMVQWLKATGKIVLKAPAQRRKRRRKAMA